MKYLVRLTGRSLRDMEIIYNYVEADASQHAFAWFNRLAKQFIVWSDFPAAARSSLKTKSFATSFLESNLTSTELFTPWINAIMLCTCSTFGRAPGAHFRQMRRPPEAFSTLRVTETSLHISIRERV